MKTLKQISLALLSTFVIGTQSAVAEVLTEIQLHATLGIVTNFILDDGISHNGTTYGKVTSPYTGRVWLDRNLGAKRVCTSLDDTECYGDYYQWGRNHDGHEKSNSFDYSILATNVTTVGHADFITNSILPRDWASVDADGAIRVSNWTATDGSSVCPVGFRVPTMAELNAELIDVGSAEITNNTDAFNSFLRLPSSGNRSGASAFIYNMGLFGYVLSSSLSGGTYVRLVYFSGANAGSSVSYRNDGFSVRCIKSQTHTHNGTTYGEVISPYTGKVWLDRNLGANRVCTALDDTECYGDYYQWGRNADGHQVSTSNITSSLASNIYTVGHGDFITNSTSPYDWASLDLAGTGRSTNWLATDGSSVCPVGFRVPNMIELRAELIDVGSAEIASTTDAFNSFLRLPSAGLRSNDSASLGIQGLRGYMWSSDIFNGTNAYYAILSSSGAFSLENYRTYGFTVRCLKD